MTSTAGAISEAAGEQHQAQRRELDLAGLDRLGDVRASRGGARPPPTRTKRRASRRRGCARCSTPPSSATKAYGKSRDDQGHEGEQDQLQRRHAMARARARGGRARRGAGDRAPGRRARRDLAHRSRRVADERRHEERPAHQPDADRHDQRVDQAGAVTARDPVAQEPDDRDRQSAPGRRGRAHRRPMGTPRAPCASRMTHVQSPVTVSDSPTARSDPRLRVGRPISQDAGDDRDRRDHARHLVEQVLGRCVEGQEVGRDERGAGDEHGGAQAAGIGRQRRWTSARRVEMCPGPRCGVRAPMTVRPQRRSWGYPKGPTSTLHKEHGAAVGATVSHEATWGRNTRSMSSARGHRRRRPRRSEVS